GDGGRTVPSTVIDNDNPGDVEAPGAVFDPDNDGIDFYESLEGMRVQINDPVAVSPARSFGGVTPNHEIAVGGRNRANPTSMTPRGGVVLRPGDFNPERIILNDATNSTLLPSDVNVGATHAGTINGVIDYSFANFKFQVTESAQVTFTGGVDREVTLLPSPSP